MRALEYLLKLRSWQWFGTCTWSDSKLGTARSRENDLDEFLRQWAATAHVSLSDMPLVIRWERGEQTDRPHCHWLLDGFPPSTNLSPSFGYMRSALWHRQHGLARIRLWNSSQRENVARYMFKDVTEQEISAHHTKSGANEYEVCKFDDADRVLFNKALWRDLQRITQTSFDVAQTT